MTMIVNPSQIIMVVNAFHTWPWLSTHFPLHVTMILNAFQKKHVCLSSPYNHGSQRSPHSQRCTHDHGC